MAIACKLIVDSCCDLPASYLDREGVELINFSYTVNGQDFKDDLFTSLTPKEFYDDMRFGGMPQTSQVSPLLLREVLGKAAESGEPTIFFCFSASLSGTFDSACLVADQLKEEYPQSKLVVFDTALASVAEGSFIEEALRMQAHGFTQDEMLEWARRTRKRLACQFMVDDLEALRRGGRIPSTVAAVGGKLDVKPMLTIAEDGSLSVAGISRGRKKGMKTLVGVLTKNVPPDKRGMLTIIIGHADCLDDAELLRKAVEKEAFGARVIVSNVGPVIGSHVGPGMLALSFFKPE